MPAREINDPKHWYDRAAEMRALSETMTNNHTKTQMLRLADDYDKLGDRAVTRAKPLGEYVSQKPIYSGNLLLEAMPQRVINLLTQSMLLVKLPQGFVCFDSGDPIQDVYFPISGLITLVISMEGGHLVEAGVIGREGAAGLPSVFGQQLSFTHGVVQIAGTFCKISAEPLTRAIDQSEDARKVIYRHAETVLAEAQRLAACNAIHHAGSRLARWLLQAADRTGADCLELTQEVIGEMLGLRRTSVTLLAQELQDRGIIRYSRGRISIVDRKALEASACGCFQFIQKLYRGLYSGPKNASDDDGSITAETGIGGL